MDIVLALIGKYYGLDWLTLAFGLTSSVLVSNHRIRPGLACGIVACIGGLFVAAMPGQTGFIVYNALLISINLRGIMRGDRRGLSRQSEIMQPEAAVVSARAQ